ncbi:MAG: hypothetical protein LBR15_09725 [Methanobrevibacter sp.]|nr:hypothetical protein [Candidatus Methanovirga australis]
MTSVKDLIESLSKMGFPLIDFWVNDNILFLFPVSCTVSYNLYNKLIEYEFECKLSKYLNMVSIEIIGSPLNTFRQIVDAFNQESLVLLF